MTPEPEGPPAGGGEALRRPAGRALRQGLTRSASSGPVTKRSRLGSRRSGGRRSDASESRPEALPPVPSRWGDLDAQGHVNNGFYVDYLQEARVHFLLTGPPEARDLLDSGVLVVSHRSSTCGRWVPSTR